MRSFLSFAGLLCIAFALAAHAQNAPMAGVDPFEIDRGTSFAASPSRPRVEAPKVTSAAALIVSDVRQALELIQTNHIGGTTLDSADLTKASISGMLAELDPHSSYFDPAEFSELLGEQESEYSGTGSTIANFIRNGEVGTYILSTHRDSAAARAGLEYGDRIVAVDGMSVTGLDSEVVRNRVRGPRGTFVRLTIERAATGRVETIALKRERIFQPTLPNFFIIRDGVAYIDMSEGFSHTTATEFDTALKELHRRGMTSLVLDLRGNSGGILDQAVCVAERFLPAGSSIISQRGRLAIDNREWRSASRDPELVPLVVLVDERTASASEVVAGALQDNDRALILGQNTFGKGLVQNVVELPGGAGLTLTTARYYTPSGRSIQRSYNNAGLYDYFNHRVDTADDHTSARTTTNRVVFGGNGIAPDEVFDGEKYDAERARLLDPIFFYVRETIYRRPTTVAGDVGSRDEIRQAIIFGNQPAGKSLLAGFRAYAEKSGWDVTPAAVDKNLDFIERRLNYELALAAFGTDAAKQSQVVSDIEIAKAIEALPRAAILAEAARQTRITPQNKKTHRVASPAGQGRNRRN